MAPERWRRIEQLYHSALGRAPGERAAYLTVECRGDEELRREVESLLSEGQEGGAFLERPVLEVAAEQYVSAVVPDLMGRKLGRYEIISRLGAGGMGEVYRARDTRLKREVALKVLPRECVADPERKQRFVQEARSASALNHPHIVAIHDIDQAEGIDFIAMEYVPGKTLDQVIPRQGLRLRETLQYAVEIAGALAAAHGAGIVHRDVKPSNIMVTAAGQVKLLDFGLAKLVEATAAGEQGPTSTPPVQTVEGAVVGTASYMSPEQAQGKPVDARSDIFSFGSVLYEMVTGRRAFQGDTKMSTLAAIIDREPAPLKAEVPEDLKKVITRCLRKDLARRFQHMDDVQIALQELSEESGSAAPVRAAPAATHSRRRQAWIAGGFVLASALGFGAWFGLFRWPAARPVPKVSAFAALPGYHWGPALSADGKQVAFVWNGEEPDNYDIYVQLVSEATPRRLTSDPAFEYSPVWSPDGIYIAFLREAAGGTDVLIIPASGGVERRVYTSAADCGFPYKKFARQFCGIAWSPDGKSLTVVDKESPQGPQSIYLLDIESREKHKLTAPPAGWYGDGQSAFSPDGRALAFIRTPAPYPSDIYVLPISKTGQAAAETRRVTHASDFIFGLDWTADGSGIIFSSGQAGMFALWRVAASGGEPERLPVGGNYAFWPSVSRKGGLLAYSEGATVFNLWRAALPGAGVSIDARAPTRLTYSPVTDFQPAFSPDGNRIAFASWRSGKIEIWTCGADGSSPTRLTYVNGKLGSPAWSPDGQQITFWGGPLGTPVQQVYAVGAGGGTPRRLTRDAFAEALPSWSRDRRWIYFSSDRGTGWQVWKAPVDRGPPVQLTRKGGFRPIGSVDGKSVYYGRDNSIWRIAAEGGDETPVLDLGGPGLWTVSESGIYILDLDAKTGPAIDFFIFSTRERMRLLKLPGEPDAYSLSGVDSFTVSPDRSWIVYAHRDRDEANIMLVENFR